MQVEHNATINVGNNNYDYEFVTITKTFAGGKKDNDGTTIYLEDERGKVKTVYSGFDIDIPPSTQQISLLYREDKKKERLFPFALYLHSNDFVGYLTQDSKANTAKRMISLTGWKATLEKWHIVIALFLALFCAWSALFSSVHFDRHGYAVIFTHMPYILLDTAYLITNYDFVPKSYFSAFWVFILSFITIKFVLNAPVKYARKKVHEAFGNDLADRLPKLFDGSQAHSTLSASPTGAEQTQTSNDGFQPLV